MKLASWSTLILGTFTLLWWFVPGIFVIALGVFLLACVEEPIRDNLGQKLPRELILVNIHKGKRLRAYEIDYALGAKWWRIGTDDKFVLVAGREECPITYLSPDIFGIDLRKYAKLGQIERVDDNLKDYDLAKGFYVQYGTKGDKHDAESSKIEQNYGA